MTFAKTMNPNAATDLWIELFAGAVAVFIGARMAWFPRRGKRETHPQGYLFIIIGLGLIFVGLWDAGFFGDSKFFALIPGAIGIGLFVFWLRRRRS